MIDYIFFNTIIVIIIFGLIFGFGIVVSNCVEGDNMKKEKVIKRKNNYIKKAINDLGRAVLLFLANLFLIICFFSLLKYSLFSVYISFFVVFIFFFVLINMFMSIWYLMLFVGRLIRGNN